MKKKKLLVYLGMLSFLSQAYAADMAGGNAQTCDQALAAGKFAQAASLAEHAVKKDPKDRNAYLCLGRARGESGDKAAALSAFQTALKLAEQPTDKIVALTLLGNFYKSEKEYENALVEYRKGMAIAVQDRSVAYQRIEHNLIGESLAASGNVEKALDHYLKGMALAANDNERADSSAHVAAAYNALGQHEKAIEHQVQAVMLEEKSGDLDHYAEANIALAGFCLDAKDYHDATRWLDRFMRVIKMNHNPYWEAKAHQFMGRVKLAQGNQEAADQQFKLGKALAQKIGAQQLVQEIDKDAAATSSL